ncbi:MAG TPA: GntR family transcriptional regulator [Nocardioides sp.]|nr:GntR family transcriptional regulator [Nocardioides sp.]
MERGEGDDVPHEVATAPRLLADGAEPKHAQLRAVLAEMCAADLAAGSAIPSERELMLGYGVSRATVRRAIESLVAEGALRRVQGKGTFVSAPRVQSHLHLASFTQDMRRRGKEPSSRVVRVASAAPPPGVAAWLGLADGAAAWLVERVRLASGEPMAFEAGWYSPTLLPGLDRHDLAGSLYELFAQVYDLPVDTAEQTVRAQPADATLAHHLDVEPGDAVLAFDRLSRSGGAPLEHVVSHYRGDRYELHVSLDSTMEGTP